MAQAQTDTTERWPLTFANAARAVSWADRFLTQPRVKSQYGAMLQSALQNQIRRSVDQYGETITLRRLTDLAETITVCLSSVKNPAGSLYRHVHGVYPHTLQAADQLAHLVWDGPGARRTRTIAKMRVLAALMIEDARQRARYGKGIKAVDVAKQLNMPRDCYYDNWFQYAGIIREHIAQLLTRAGREMDEMLSEKGVL